MRSAALLRALPLSYLRIARRNIALCLPELSEAERETLLDRHCRSLGMALCETADTWWSSDERLNRLAEVQGLHHLEAALAKGRGAILVGGHFTTIEISTRILGTVVPAQCRLPPHEKRPAIAHYVRKLLPPWQSDTEGRHQEHGAGAEKK